MIALLQALNLANATIKNRWPRTAAPTTVVILLGRPCKEIMELITHHIEHGPESYTSLQSPHRSTVKHIIKRIHQIRHAGFKVSVNMSDHHHSDVQIAAAREAERRFKRACHEVRKLVTKKAQSKRPVSATERASFEDPRYGLPIRLSTASTSCDELARVPQDNDVDASDEVLET